MGDAVGLFSSSDQALLGENTAEDCLFGSSSSIFYIPDEDHSSAQEVKKTYPRKPVADESVPSHSSPSVGLEQPSSTAKSQKLR